MPRRKAQQLSERDIAVLALEREWGQAPHLYRHKMHAVKHRLGLEEPAYNLILAALLEDPLAWDHDPEIVARLKEVRRARHTAMHDPPPQWVRDDGPLME